MATTSDATSRVLVYNQITRVVLLNGDVHQGIIAALKDTGVNYNSLLQLKLLLPEQSASIVIPVGSYANNLLARLSSAAMTKFMQGQMRRLYR